MSDLPFGSMEGREPDAAATAGEVGRFGPESTNLYLVFSLPAARVSDAEFNGWYDKHIPEILETPGFLSARRFRLDPIVSGSEQEAAFRFLVLYETEGDINALRAALDARVSSGEIVLPEWFAETRYLTWSCVPVAEAVRRRA